MKKYKTIIHLSHGICVTLDDIDEAAVESIKSVLEFEHKNIINTDKLERTKVIPVRNIILVEFEEFK